MSDDSPQGRRSTRKRNAPEAVEELEASPRNRRGSRTPSASRKAPKLTDNEDTTPLTAPESPQSTPTATQTPTKAATPEPTPTKPAPAETVQETKNENKMDVTPSTPTPAKATTAVAKASSAAKKSSATASPARASSPAPVKQAPKSQDPNDFSALYAGLAQKKYTPYQKKKLSSTAPVPSMPSDLEICDCVRDISEIVNESALEAVLEVTFPACETVASRRPAFLKEMYRVLSI